MKGDLRQKYPCILKAIKTEQERAGGGGVCGGFWRIRIRFTDPHYWHKPGTVIFALCSFASYIEVQMTIHEGRPETKISL
jgi:hypothetical protein